MLGLAAGKSHQMYTERLEGVVTGVVTTKLVVTTQGARGGCNNPQHPLFHVFWGNNLTTPLLRPFSGRRILFKCPLHTARCDARCDFEVCASGPAAATRGRSALADISNRNKGLQDYGKGGKVGIALAPSPARPPVLCACAPLRAEVETQYLPMPFAHRRLAKRLI